MNSVADVWNRVLEILGENLTSVAISTWFEDCKAVDLDDNKLVLTTPSNFKKSIIEGRFISSIKAAMYDIFASDFEISILSSEELNNYAAANSQKKSLLDSEEYTFEHFVVGSSNKFAHAAAMAVAEDQSTKYNPLFIYGDSGLGKTHLLYAIRHAVKSKHPDYSIVYVKGDDFTNELISAIQTGRNVEFREKYRNADFFLIDDIQFIAGKTSTEEEFFHSFNALYESNCQIVMTSDRPPSEMTRLSDRLKTRFESGLIADIQPPDYETRMAIIKNKAKQLNLNLSDQICDYIAVKFTSNIRQLEGIVKKIKAYSEILDDNISISTIPEVLKDMYKENTEYIPTPDAIIEETAKYYSLISDDLKGQSKTKNVSLARHISIYLIRKLTNLSFKDIGSYYEDRDHSTIIYSVKKIEDTMKKSESFTKIIKEITANINSRN